MNIMAHSKVMGLDSKDWHVTNGKLKCPMMCQNKILNIAYSPVGICSETAMEGYLE